MSEYVIAFLVVLALVLVGEILGQIARRRNE